MATYTDEQTFGPYGETHPDALIQIDANGGQVAIVTIMDDGTEIALPDGPFDADTSFRLEVAHGKFKVTPTGGAKYDWQA